MSAADLFAISCFPVDCLANRAFVMSLGVMPDQVPWPLPYDGSVKGECQGHHGPIWIGPEQQKLIKKAEQKGDSALVICHICSTIWAKENDANISMIALSDKTTVNPRDN